MIMKVYSVFDSKATAFLQPFFAVNRAVALRSFARAVNEEGSDFHLYAGDYTLFELGEWDQMSGKFVAGDVMENLGIGSQYLKELS